MDWRAENSLWRLSSILLHLILFYNREVKTDVSLVTYYNNGNVEAYQDLPKFHQQIDIINGTFGIVNSLTVSNEKTYVVLYSYNYEQLEVRKCTAGHFGLSLIRTCTGS